jgi:hypothetical protein
MLVLLWSTAIPIDLANYYPNPAAFNSYKENPLPILNFLLYLTVYPLTTGLKASVGLGKT